MAGSFTFENANEMRACFPFREVNNVDPTRMLPHFATVWKGSTSNQREIIEREKVRKVIYIMSLIVMIGMESTTDSLYWHWSVNNA